PTTEARWNFKYIQAFQNPRPVKTKNCSAPRYMYVDAVYEIPDFYWKDKNGNTVEPYMDCPNAIGPLSMTNNLCYKTVTLLVEITEYTANAGLSVAKVMPCPNCSKLCNKPFNREVLVPDEDCEEETKREAMYNALLQYRQHIEQMAAEFDKEYADRCFIPDNETFELEYKLWQYHYTLYYFDQAGQLIKTVPPAGVDIDNENLSQAQRQALVEDRAVTAKLHRENNTNPRAKTYHSLITNYRYNTLGLPAWQYTPDGGVSHTWYDALARPTFSQNSKQVLTDKYSYIKYDNLGRPVETGETEFGPSFMLYKHDFSSATVYNNVVSEKEVGPISFYKIGLDATIDVHESSNNRFLRIRPANNTINETNTETNLTLESGKTYTVLFDVAFNGNTNLDCIITSYSTLTNPPSSVVLLNSTAIGSGLFTSNITVPVNSTEVKLVFTGHHNSSNSPDDVLLIDDFQISTTSLPAHKPTSRNLATSGYIASFIASGQHKEVTKTSFDIPFNSARANTAFPEGIKNTRNRPISQCYEEIEDNKKETYDVATIMSYDIHGNVIKAVKDVPVLTHITDGYFTIESQYDLLTGKTNSVTYQKGKRDQWIHKYYYDADNRLVSIYTSRDAINWENDAKYFYSLSGNLARTELGELKVQGLDYAATVNGWIKGVNGGSLTPDQDIGLDGYVSTTNTNRYVGRDAFGYILSYFNNDYVNISGEHVDADRTGSDLQGKTNGRELFNGNIMQMQVALPKNRGANSWAGNNTAGPPSRVITPEVLGNVYHYDQLNRITKHYAFDEFAAPSTTSPYLGGTWLNSGKTGTDKYYETFAFDPNGNITALNRNSGTIVSGATDYKMDEMTYEYDKVSVTITLQQNTSISYTLLNLQSNKLYKVNDNVNASFYDNDIDAQGAGNYVYDNLGNLIEDKAEHIQEITWNNAGKIKKVIRKNTTAKADLEFGYDEGGQRLWKLVIPKEEVSPSTSPKTYKYKQQEFWDTTWYLGSARYSMQHLRKVNGFDTLFKQWTLDELDIVGQSRHGLYKPSEVIGLRNIKLDPITGYDENGRFITAEGGLGIYWNSSKFELSRDNKICILVRGNKQYELSNHLGNVLVTVSDRKGSRQLAGTTGNNADYYLPYILTITDYYAFGSTITERSASFGAKYRYGFNNQEQDGELGDYYAFEYRIHDARLGRFLSVDPLAPEYPWNSTYSFAENDVVSCKELEGLEKVPATEIWDLRVVPAPHPMLGDVYKFTKVGDQWYSLREILKGPNAGNWLMTAHYCGNIFNYPAWSNKPARPAYSYEDRFIVGRERVPEKAVSRWNNFSSSNNNVLTYTFRVQMGYAMGAFDFGHFDNNGDWVIDYDSDRMWSLYKKQWTPEK
ncbi:MAG: RHS repeat domain-containing protein, partial [Bacteroidota bacterium]